MICSVLGAPASLPARSGCWPQKLAGRGARAPRSKPETESRGEHAFARKLGVTRQRIQTIILVGQVQDTDGQLRLALEETVARLQIKLHEVVAGLAQCVALVRLLVIAGIEAGEEAAEMVV